MRCQIEKYQTFVSFTLSVNTGGANKTLCTLNTKTQEEEEEEEVSSA